MYVIFWGIWAVALFWIGIRKRNRPILQAVGTKPQGNNWKYLLFGLVLGFALNGFCILIAWLHHDIVLTYDAIHPLWFVVVFLTVFIQSSAEELLCRGFLYQKLRRSYKIRWLQLSEMHCCLRCCIWRMMELRCFLS